MTPATFMRSASLALALLTLPAFCHAQGPEPVTLTEDPGSYTLSNGILTARILKRNGDLNSLKYKGTDILTDQSGHAGAYWSHDTTGGKDLITKITVNPAENGGARAEVSIKGISGGIKMGHGPGAAADGDIAADIEIRWSLGRGEAGMHTYCEFDHLPEYPAATMTEARFCAKLANFFDWMSVAQDSHHDKHYPATLREGDKYVYTTNQTNNPAFGWSSTTNKIGFFIINPSMEYMSGGPTKVEFLGHRDTTAVAAPCVLNYWRSSHYGGAAVNVAADEHWQKVLGPFYLYVNEGETPQAIYANARQMAETQKQAWPYDWVSLPAYPTSKQRAEVSGHLILSDAQRPGATLPNLLVGLTAPDPQPGSRGAIWQQDAKNYQFWARGNADGTFTVPDVRPGKYTLRAFADGVLGEFAQADVTVTEGKNVNLGKITWTPVRKGRQIFEVGIPNRYGSEFFKAEDYWSPQVAANYAKLFADDITFTIGKSDHSKDWYLVHVPRAVTPPAVPVPAAEAPAAAAPAANPPVAQAPPAGGPAAGENAPAQGPGAGGPGAPGARGAGGRGGPGARGRGGFGGGQAAGGQAAPRHIVFELPSAPRGKATLRIAMSGSAVRTIPVTVNGQEAGGIGPFVNDGVISRHGTHGIWNEKELTFDAGLLKSGSNTLTLTIPAGPLNNGVIYDYIRLELDETSTTALNQ